MAINTIITIIIVLIVLGLVFALIKKLLKWFFAVNILLIIVVAIFGYLVYTDAQEFKEKFPEYEKLLLLEKDGEILAGFEGVLTQAEEDVDYLSAEQIPADYKQTVEQYYKIFIIQLEAFRFLDQVEFRGDSLPATFVYQMLESDDPLGLYAQRISEGVPGSTTESIKQGMIGSEPQFKSQLFAALVGEAMEQKGQAFIFEGLKQGTVEIYPETIIFKLLKKSPSFITNMLIKKVAQS